MGRWTSAAAASPPRSNPPASSLATASPSSATTRTSFSKAITALHHPRHRDAAQRPPHAPPNSPPSSRHAETENSVLRSGVRILRQPAPRWLAFASVPSTSMPNTKTFIHNGRPDPRRHYVLRRRRNRRAFLHQRQHRHAKGRHAFASNPLPARATSMGSFNHDDHGVELHTIPLFHANGWGRPQTATMMGMKQVMVRRFEPPPSAGSFRTSAPLRMSIVPTMANALLHSSRPAPHYDLSSCSRSSSAAPPLRPRLIELSRRPFTATFSPATG